MFQRVGPSSCFSVLPHTNAATQQILRNEAQSGAARGPLSVSRQGEDAPLAHATSSASQQGQHVVRPCLQPPRVPGTGPPAAPSLGRAIPETHTHREAAPPDPPPIRDPPWRTDPLNRAWTQDSLSTALSQLTVLGPDDADSSEAGSDASTATTPNEAPELWLGRCATDEMLGSPTKQLPLAAVATGGGEASAAGGGSASGEARVGTPRAQESMASRMAHQRRARMQQRTALRHSSSSPNMCAPRGGQAWARSGPRPHQRLRRGRPRLAPVWARSWPHHVTQPPWATGGRGVPTSTQRSPPPPPSLWASGSRLAPSWRGATWTARSLSARRASSRCPRRRSSEPRPAGASHRRPRSLTRSPACRAHPHWGRPAAASAPPRRRSFSRGKGAFRLAAPRGETAAGAVRRRQSSKNNHELLAILSAPNATQKNRGVCLLFICCFCVAVYAVYAISSLDTEPSLRHGIC